MFGTQEDRGLAQRVEVPVAGSLLEGHLWLPSEAPAMVVFPHGRGTSRRAHDGYLAGKLGQAGLGTLLLNLLTTEEANLDARLAAFRFDIGLLAGRLAGATDWLIEQPSTRDLNVGYFGAGYGAAAALVAAAERPGVIGAVISHDGLPDLTDHALKRLTAPTLLIGGLNRTLLKQLGPGAKRFVLVPDADHALEEVARLAAVWFTTHLKVPARMKNHRDTRFLTHRCRSAQGLGGAAALSRPGDHRADGSGQDDPCSPRHPGQWSGK